MAEYKVDRALLESFSTEEIIKILNEEADDYTSDAIKIFKEILEIRGVTTDNDKQRTTEQGNAPFKPIGSQGGNILIRKPGTRCGC